MIVILLTCKLTSRGLILTALNKDSWLSDICEHTHLTLLCHEARVSDISEMDST